MEELTKQERIKKEKKNKTNHLVPKYKSFWIIAHELIKLINIYWLKQKKI